MIENIIEIIAVLALVGIASPLIFPLIAMALLGLAYILAFVWMGIIIVFLGISAIFVSVLSLIKHIRRKL